MKQQRKRAQSESDHRAESGKYQDMIVKRLAQGPRPGELREVIRLIEEERDLDGEGTKLDRAERKLGKKRIQVALHKWTVLEWERRGKPEGLPGLHFCADTIPGIVEKHPEVDSGVCKYLRARADFEKEKAFILENVGRIVSFAFWNADHRFFMQLLAIACLPSGKRQWKSVLPAIFTTDRVVGTGSNLLQRLAAARSNAIKQRREKRRPIWNKIIQMNEDKRQRGIPPNARYNQIGRELRAEGFPVSRSTILRVIHPRKK